MFKDNSNSNACTWAERKHNTEHNYGIHPHLRARYPRMIYLGYVSLLPLLRYQLIFFA